MSVRPFQHLPAFVYSPVPSNGCFGLGVILVRRAEDRSLGTFLPYQKSQIVHLLLLSTKILKVSSVPSVGPKLATL